MNRTRMLQGWEMAARKAMKKHALKDSKNIPLVPKISLAEYAEMELTRERIRNRNGSKGLGFQSNLLGKDFGLLLVWQRLDTLTNDQIFRWVCLCACGNICERSANVLLKKTRVHHCGCLRDLRRRVAKHRRKRKRMEVFADARRMRVQWVVAGRKRRPAKKFVGMQLP